jgi:hypothetical protein
MWDLVEKFISSPRETVFEENLKKQLRHLEDAEREKIVEGVLKRSSGHGLNLVKACCRRPSFFKMILKEGVKTADASYIRSWIDCVVPKIGIRATLKELGRMMREENTDIGKVFYWLGLHLRKDEKQLIEQANSLVEEYKKKFKHESKKWI